MFRAEFQTQTVTIIIGEMFPTSSQRRYWTFKNEDEIKTHRRTHNQEFQQRHGDRLGLNVNKMFI